MSSKRPYCNSVFLYKIYVFNRERIDRLCIKAGYKKIIFWKLYMIFRWIRSSLCFSLIPWNETATCQLNSIEDEHSFTQLSRPVYHLCVSIAISFLSFAWRWSCELKCRIKILWFMTVSEWLFVRVWLYVADREFSAQRTPFIYIYIDIE